MKVFKITAVLLALLMLCACGAEPKTPNEPEITKSTAAKELMSEEDIMNIAIDHAKSSAEGAVADFLAEVDVTDKKCEFTAKNGIPIYDCRFNIGILMFEYEVDQQNGAIRTYARGFDYDAPGKAGAPMIGEDAALSYALWYLDIKEADISDASSVYDEEFHDYLVRFSVGDDVYTCVIDPYDGVFERSTRDIGYNGAKEIAYNHAAQNIAEDQQDDFSNLMLAGEIKNRSTKAKGVASERTYEVGFSVGGFEYKYVIEASSGRITKVECEPDDAWKGEPVGGFDAGTVSLEKPELPDYFSDIRNTMPAENTLSEVDEDGATAIAIGHAGVSDYEILGVMQNSSGTHEVISVNFASGGYWYIYDVDSASGDIVGFVCETEAFAVAPDVPETTIRDTTGFIGEEEALNIALEDASKYAPISNALNIENGIGFERGEYVYEVSFIQGGYKFGYDISAETGEILSASWELD